MDPENNTTPTTPPSGDPATPPTGAAAMLDPGTPNVTEGAPWKNSEGVYNINVEGKEVPWWSGIQEDNIKQYMEDKQYATPDDAARAAWNAKQHMDGKSGLNIPGEDATAEEWNTLYSKLGRPETAEGYDLKFADGVEANAEFTAFGKELFHELGATPAAAQKATDKWNEYMGKAESARLSTEREQNDKDLGALITKWEGEEKLNGMKAAGIRAMKSLGMDAASVEGIEKHVGSAAIVELLAKIGNAFPEGQFKAPEGGNSDPNDINSMSPQQAEAKSVDLQSDAEFQKAYTDKNHPGHKDALSRMEALFARASNK